MKITYNKDRGQVFANGVSFKACGGVNVKSYIEKMLDRLNKGQLENIAMIILKNYGKVETKSTEDGNTQLDYTMDI